MCSELYYNICFVGVVQFGQLLSHDDVGVSGAPAGL